MFSFRTAALALAATLSSVAAQAAVEFVPDNDPVGQVYTTNSNDGWNGGRGVVFTPTSDFALDSIELYTDLTNITINATVATAPSSLGFVGGGTVLFSDSSLVNTTGLEFVGFGGTALTLSAGQAYHINFSFNGAANQNFFYDEASSMPSYSIAGFTNINGTQGSDTSNTVIARFRLNGASVNTAVPEPASWLMMLAGFGVIGGAMRARRRSSVAFA